MFDDTLDTTTLGAVEAGMDALGVDGETLGRVSHVWRGVLDSADAGRDGFIAIEHGGVLGLGSTTWYVPFADITDVVPQRCVTVNTTAEEADSRYSTKPDVLANMS